MTLLLLAIQAATLPDIQLHAAVEAQSLKVESKGEASLQVRAEPEGGSFVTVDAPRDAGTGTKQNVRVELDAQARIGSGFQETSATEAAELR